MDASQMFLELHQIMSNPIKNHSIAPVILFVIAGGVFGYENYMIILTEWSAFNKFLLQPYQ